MYQIPDLPKENNFNLDVESRIYQWKEWTLNPYGGVVLSFPSPTPLSVCVWGMANLNIQENDHVLIPRDNSNSPRVQFNPNQKHPLMLEASFFVEELIGHVKRIEKIGLPDSARIIFHGELKTKYGDAGWPKVHGAVAKVWGYDRNLMDEKLSSEVEKAKKTWGSQWADKLHDGAWKK